MKSQSEGRMLRGGESMVYSASVVMVFNMKEAKVLADIKALVKDIKITESK